MARHSPGPWQPDMAQRNRTTDDLILVHIHHRVNGTAHRFARAPCQPLPAQRQAAYRRAQEQIQPQVSRALSASPTMVHLPWIFISVITSVPQWSTLPSIANV